MKVFRINTSETKQKSAGNRYGRATSLSLLVLCLSIFLVCMAHAGYIIEELDQEIQDKQSETTQHSDLETTEYMENNTTEEPIAVAEDTNIHKIQLRLDGATSYRTVEIFNQLIKSIPLVSNIERTRMVIVPGNSSRSITHWQMDTNEQDTFNIESQLYTHIKGLPLEGKGAHLQDLSFTPNEDDIEQVKKIIPYSATLENLHFVKGKGSPNALNHVVTVDPFYTTVFDKGFD